MVTQQVKRYFKGQQFFFNFKRIDETRPNIKFLHQIIIQQYNSQSKRKILPSFLTTKTMFDLGKKIKKSNIQIMLPIDKDAKRQKNAFEVEGNANNRRGQRIIEDQSLRKRKSSFTNCAVRATTKSSDFLSIIRKYKAREQQQQEKIEQ